MTKKTSRKKGVSAKAGKAKLARGAIASGASGEPVGASSDRTLKIQRWYKPRKLPVTLRLDAEVLDWFQREGRGYQTRINQALRRMVMKAKGK
jgi:uncharacterized protein (DUF4415 family)